MTNAVVRSGSEQRRVGRPRSAAADDAIRVATLEVFAEAGFDGLRVEAVAERAGVAKSTLYRRFPTKLDLVHHALSSTVDQLGCPHTDSLHDDIVSLARHLRDTFAAPDVGAVVPAVLQAISRHEDLRDLHHRMVAQRRERGLERLRAAVEAGELPKGTDVNLLMDQLSGTVFYRSFVSRGALDGPALDALVRVTLTGHGD